MVDFLDSTDRLITQARFMNQGDEISREEVIYYPFYTKV